MEESKSGPSAAPSGSASRQVSSVADVGVFHSWNCPPQRPCSSHRPVWSRPSSPAAFPNPLGCRPLTVTRLSPRFRCRVGGGAPRGRWPPSTAQTVRAVFPHTAFTKTSSRDEDRWRNQRVDPPPPRRVQPVGKSPRSLMLGYFTHGTVHLSALAHLTVLSGPDRLRRPPSPTHSVAARGRSRGFHRASGNIRPSDSSTSVPSHFALAYRVGCRGGGRGPAEVSQGHALVFRTVPSANTLVRWVDENAFARIVQARPCPTFGRPVRHGVAPSTTARYCSANPSDPTSRWAPCPPQFRRGGSRSTLAVSGFRLRARVGVSIPATCGRRGITPAFGYGPPHPGTGGT